MRQATQLRNRQPLVFPLSRRFKVIPRNMFSYRCSFLFERERSLKSPSSSRYKPMSYTVPLPYSKKHWKKSPDDGPFLGGLTLRPSLRNPFQGFAEYSNHGPCLHAIASGEYADGAGHTGKESPFTSCG